MDDHYIQYPEDSDLADPEKARKYVQEETEKEIAALESINKADYPCLFGTAKQMGKKKNRRKAQILLESAAAHQLPTKTKGE